MKTINAMTFKNLRNDEFYGLFCQGVKFAREISEKDLQASINGLDSVVKELGEFLETSFAESSETLASQLDKERNAVYLSCKRVARGSVDYPDEAQAAVWAQVWRVIDESPNPLCNNQVQSTGIFLNLIASLRRIGDEALESVGFKVRLDQLEEVNAKFMDADNVRLTERGKRELELTKKLRTACMEAFDKLVLDVTYKASNGSAACGTFIDSMNEAIDVKKAQVKARSAAKPKKKDDSKNAANSAADAAEAANAAPTSDNASSVGVENAA